MMMSEMVRAVGGNMGDAFDDDIFDGVRKIIVGRDFNCVTYIKIEYEKDGKFETRERGINRGQLRGDKKILTLLSINWFLSNPLKANTLFLMENEIQFTVDYPNEYITSVSGGFGYVFNYRTVLINSLVFRTTYDRTSPVLGVTTLFGNPYGRGFTLEGSNGGKLLGFHGRSGDALDAFGPHFFAVRPPLRHFQRQGGNGGYAWDDGAFDGVRKVLVGRGGRFVTYVRFEYARGERMIPHDHGKRREVPQEFVVDYPREDIITVEGTIDGYVTSLRFKTSKGRMSPTFGNVVGRKFVFEEQGFKLVGVCGRSGDAIDALGAHFAVVPTSAPTSSPTATSTPVIPTIKLQAQGGGGGVSWDDGAHDNVRKVYVGQGVSGVAFVKFEYSKGSELLAGNGHGKKSLLGTEEFVVDPDDYIISVKGYYEKIFGFETQVITSLIFKTSKGITSQPFGVVSGEMFLLEGGKIVGFHGTSSDVLHSIGAHIVKK